MRHGGDQQHGIVDRYLGSFRYSCFSITAKHIVYTDHIGQEQRVKLPPFEQLSQFHPLG